MKQQPSYSRWTCWPTAWPNKKGSTVRTLMRSARNGHMSIGGGVKMVIQSVINRQRTIKELKFGSLSNEPHPIGGRLQFSKLFYRVQKKYHFPSIWFKTGLDGCWNNYKLIKWMAFFYHLSIFFLFLWTRLCLFILSLPRVTFLRDPATQENGHYRIQDWNLTRWVDFP